MSGSGHGASLRLRIAAVVLLAVVPVLVVLASAVAAERGSDRRNANRTLLTSSQLVAAHETRLLADVSGTLAILAGDPRLLTGACPRVLAAGLARQPAIDNLGVIGSRGTVICSGRPMPRRSISGTAMLSAVRRARGFATTRYELSDITHRPAIHAGYPIAGRIDRRDVVSGVVFASVRADWLGTAVTPATVPAGGAVVLLAEDGTVMARVPDPDRLTGHRLTASPVVAAALASRSVSIRRLIGIDGVPRRWAFRPLGPKDSPSGRLVVGLSEASLYARTNRLVTTTLLAGGVAASAAAVAAWTLGTRLVRRPVARVLDVVRRLEEGDVSARIGRSGGGELAAVGAGIDRMADALAAREERLRAAQRRFAVAFRDAPIGIVLVSLDPADRWVQANVVLLELLGIGEPALDALALDNLIVAEDRDEVSERLAVLCRGERSSVEVEARLVRCDGAPVWVRAAVSLVRDRIADTESVYLIAQVQDVTEHRADRLRLEHLALHDSLTGLANRRLVSDRIDQAVARAARTGEHFTLIFADLDQFKAINDTLGHEVGDAVLVEVARRLRRELRPSDTAARLGGDEFVAVCEGLGTELSAAWTKAVALADRLAAALEPQVVCGGHAVAVEASFGVSVPGGPPRAAEELLRDADTAMYRAKSAGGGRVAVFDAEARSSVLSRLELQAALRHHLDALELHYQPIVDLTTRHPVGAEALARWSDPARGPVPAAEFIAVAEQSGLIVRLGERVLDLVAGHLAAARGRPRHVHVNVSAVQLARSDLAGGLLRTFAARGVSPERLSVEITESALLEPGGSARVQLSALRQAGVRVGVDDFGTGYASLAALRRLPLDFVKVDRRFVAGMLTDRRDRAVVRSVISLAGDIGLSVFAEGVETAGQADALAEFGCGYAQGWLFGRPSACPASPPGLDD